MCEILIQVTCPHCEGTKVKKNGKKGNGKQNFYCHPCHIQLHYKNKGADPRNKRLVRCMTLNGSGIRDIQRVLGLSIVCILFILRVWFKTLDEPIVEGHFKRVQIDEMWTFVKHRKAGKRWVWYRGKYFSYAVFHNTKSRFYSLLWASRIVCSFSTTL